MTTEEAIIVNRWDKVGLLEGILIVEEKLKIALLLEDMAKYILTEVARHPELREHEVNNILLPIVRRVYANGVIISTKELYEYVCENYEKCRNIVNNTPHYFSIDMDAEAIAFLCDNLIKKQSDGKNNK